MMSDASAADCGWFAKHAREAIGGNVEAARRLEHEASDWLKGLDTRPFAVLRDEARRQQAMIAASAAAANEDDLQRCRNRTWPIRQACADAVQMLVDILDRHVADRKAAFDRAVYAGAIGECERWLGLQPLKSALRGTG